MQDYYQFSFPPNMNNSHFTSSFATTTLNPTAADVAQFGTDQPLHPSASTLSSPTTSRKRGMTESKAPRKKKASASSTKSMSDSDNDQKRNKLGYQRSTIACVNCRRRKIRCMVSAKDTGGKCAHCTRLNKDCAFLPVDHAVAARKKNIIRKHTDATAQATATSPHLRKESHQSNRSNISDHQHRLMPASRPSTGFDEEQHRMPDLTFPAPSSPYHHGTEFSFLPPERLSRPREDPIPSSSRSAGLTDPHYMYTLPNNNIWPYSASNIANSSYAAAATDAEQSTSSYFPAMSESALFNSLETLHAAEERQTKKLALPPFPSPPDQQQDTLYSSLAESATPFPNHQRSHTLSIPTEKAYTPDDSTNYLSPPPGDFLPTSIPEPPSLAPLPAAMESYLSPLTSESMSSANRYFASPTFFAQTMSTEIALSPVMQQCNKIQEPSLRRIPTSTSTNSNSSTPFSWQQSFSPTMEGDLYFTLKQPPTSEPPEKLKTSNTAMEKSLQQHREGRWYE